MIDDRQAMDRIQQAVRRYARSAITRGEALDDLVDILEASGRDVTDQTGDIRVASEPRSWAASGGDDPTAANPSRDSATPARNQPTLPF